MSSQTQPASSSTLVVGLNPALQKRFVLAPDDKLIPGNVHRASSIQQGVGGKGQDVFITLSSLFKSSSPTSPQQQKPFKSNMSKLINLAQFIGKGPEGDNVLKLLRDCCDEDFQYHDTCTIRTESPIRTCTTIVASDDSTELVEPSGLVQPEELSQLMSNLEKIAAESRSTSSVNSICIMGSMPPGCPPSTYAEILQCAIDTSEKSSSKQYLCLIDSVIGLDPLLEELKSKKKAAEKHSIQVKVALKINLSELANLGQTDSGLKDSISTVVDNFLTKYESARSALDYIAMTDGKNSAHLVQLSSHQNQTTFWKLRIPNLQQIYPEKTTLYPIGAGDAVAAGTLAAWTELSSPSDSENSNCSKKDHVSLQSILKQSYQKQGDDPMATAFAFGLACGSASCLQEQNSVLNTGDVTKIFDGMTADTLD